MSLTLALEIPFRLRGYDGYVSIAYGEDQDPARWGFDVPGMLYQPFDLELAKGYPVCEARITYDGPGYRAMMGWIQLITHRDPLTGTEKETTVDLAPMLSNADSPFFTFGYAPTFFDAPANPDQGTVDWIAETFLVVSPDVARTRTIAALLGFRWGYALRGMRATPLTVEPLGPETWERMREALQADYPTWRFLPGFAADL